VCSLSEGWQVTDAVIDRAPTWDEVVGEGGGEGSGGLMLRIEGMGLDEWQGEGDDDDDERDSAMLDEEELEGLVKRLESGLEGLKRVVDLGTSHVDVNMDESGREEQHTETEMED
jgi:hypothetical protein